MRAYPQILKMLRIELVDNRKTPAILPQKPDQPGLADYPNHFVTVLLHHDDAVHAAAKRFDCRRQVGRHGECRQRFLGPEVLDILQWDLASLPCFLRQFLKRSELVVGRVGQSHRQQEVRIEIRVVKRADSRGMLSGLPNQQNRGARLDQNLQNDLAKVGSLHDIENFLLLGRCEAAETHVGSLLNSGIDLHKLEIVWADKLPYRYLPPVTARKGRVRWILDRGIVDEILDGRLGHGLRAPRPGRLGDAVQAVSEAVSVRRRCRREVRKMHGRVSRVRGAGVGAGARRGNGRLG